MSYIFPRHTKQNLPKAVRGEGCYLFDETGKSYLDGSGGAAVSCLGHNDQDIITAIQEQIAGLAYAHTAFFSSKPAEELASILSKKAPDGLDKVYFVSGGSEAIEAAIKLARQYYVESGENQREHIISRRQSYHGNTLGALAVGGNIWRRKQFAPLLIDISHIAPCYEYIMRNTQETAFDYGQRAAQELEDEILRVGHKKVMAFIAEPVVGATLGAVPPVDGYFKSIREICDKYGILLILDEVMCGMGRTGSLFALEQEGIFADITTLAKGLGAGYQPIAAVMAAETIISTIQEGTGILWNGHTYMSHSIATAGALAVQKVIEDENLLKNVKMRGNQLASELKKQLDGKENIGDIRGRGLFWTVELVRDKLTKKPFPADLQLAQRIKINAQELGLMCYPAQGCADGKNGDHVLLAPAYNSTINEIDLIAETIGKAIRTALSEVNC